MIKNLFRNPKSTLTANTRPAPEYLPGYNFFPLAALQPLDEGQSRASQVVAHAQKEFRVILPFHDKGRLPILIS